MHLTSNSIFSAAALLLAIPLKRSSQNIGTIPKRKNKLRFITKYSMQHSDKKDV